MADGRLLRGERTRLAVLDAAVATASVEGLEGMSLAGLAKQLEVSKSGLFAHWPDKQQLQLDVVRHAEQQWTDFIVTPALSEPTPLLRLWALHVRRLEFYAARVLPGGCFFASVSPEFDDRPGPVRDAIAKALTEWTGLLAGIAGQAVKRGELRADIDPRQLAFELQAMGEAVVSQSRLLGRRKAITWSRRAVLDRLRGLAIDPSILPEE